MQRSIWSDMATKENILFYINAKISSLGKLEEGISPGRPLVLQIYYSWQKLMADRQEGHTKHGYTCLDFSAVSWAQEKSNGGHNDQQLIKQNVCFKVSGSWTAESIGKGKTV